MRCGRRAVCQIGRGAAQRRAYLPIAGLQRVQAGDKVYVGMSGGVDSSVAAWLLAECGADVEAVFMRNWDTRDERGECPSERDWRDVQRVCGQLGIKCHQIDLVKQYWNQVFAVALDEFAAGRTPNPDILCNSQIKFGVLLDEIARRLAGSGAWFATGHYAQTELDVNSKQPVLRRGADDKKDQSYYLSGLASTQLRRVLFPLGTLDKARDVRQIARRARLATAEKEESMGICFVGERRRFGEFIAEYLPLKPGDILSSDSRTIGTHGGLFTKTIGQSARISGMAGKWYIYAKDAKSNRMYAVEGREHPLLYTGRVVAGPVHWVAGAPPDLGADNQLRLSAQVRYMQEPQPCVATILPDGDVSVAFDRAQYGVASGQYLVLYAGERCLGCAQVQDGELGARWQ
ncbi:hypothetical protein IWQ57_003067 [Coemansia nantahalensis]|uniref:Uncharacterized protein n=1 Tax=Coemansia nantahalensis TaxID=2789366 RepID=A0ACC1JXX8_9FUNG|nr:hypothetical protein IWQ57_003067 [Coemansia nantahalensis]